MKALLMIISLVAALVLLGFLTGGREVSLLARAGQPSSRPECQSCHDDLWLAADVPPVAAVAGHGSGPGTDDPTAHAAPQIVVIDQIAEHYSAVTFDHRVHADMSEISGGCGNCHHNMAEGEAVVACRECHPAGRNGGSLTKPSLKGAYHRQCLGCHRDWSHENGCGYCHVEQSAGTDGNHAAEPGEVTLAAHAGIESARTYVYQTGNDSGPLVSFHHLDHAQSFGLRCADCHRGGACTSCHDGALQSHDTTNRMSSCRACHATNQCTFCHSQESRPKFEHAKLTGWNLEPQHADDSCINCHGRVEAFVLPSNNCRACHGGLDARTFDHRITGVPLMGSHADFDCTRCHAASRADSPATCNGCHAEKSYPAQLPGQPPVI